MAPIRAVYYLECTLAVLHGLDFGPDDFIIDEHHEATPEVSRLRHEYRVRKNSGSPLLLMETSALAVRI